MSAKAINRWDLRPEADGCVRVMYTNLQSGGTMDCGSTDDSFETLVEWMQIQADGSATVWMNNEIVGMWQ